MAGFGALMLLVSSFRVILYAKEKAFAICETLDAWVVAITLFTPIHCKYSRVADYGIGSLSMDSLWSIYD